MDFPLHEVFTVREKGWNGIKNGELIRLLIADNFEVLLTFDKNLQHHQNFEKYPITVIVLTAENNTYAKLSLLTAEINLVLRQDSLSSGVVIISSGNRGR